MKIVLGSHDFLPNVGGVATTVSILAQGFRDAGHDVTVVTISRGPTQGYGYAVVRSPPVWRFVSCTLVLISLFFPIWRSD